MLFGTVSAVKQTNILCEKSWCCYILIDRIEWRRAWSCLIQSATIVGSSTHRSFSSLTRRTCLPTKFAHRLWPSASQSTEVLSGCLLLCFIYHPVFVYNITQLTRVITVDNYLYFIAVFLVWLRAYVHSIFCSIFVTFWGRWWRSSVW